MNQKNKKHPWKSACNPYNPRGEQKGVAALLTIVIVGAATLIMAYSASLLGLGELDMGYTSQQAAETFAIADGCMEETLHQLRLDSGYTGATLNLGDGSCTIEVSGGLITVTANIDSKYYKKIQAGYSISNNVVSVTSWQELTN